MRSSLSHLKFSRGAIHYDRAARVQREVADRVEALFPEVGAAGSVLEVGCGTGYLTQKLALRYSDRPITATDVSPGMVEQAKQRLGREANVEFRVHEGILCEGSEKFALATSSSALHWIQPLDRALQLVHRLLRVDGSFVGAMMVDGTLGELRRLRSDLFPAKSFSNHLPDAELVRSQLEEAGFDVRQYLVTDHIDTYGTAGELLRVVHNLGFSHQSLSLATPLTRGELSLLAEVYQERYGASNGGVFATYRVAYFVARKH